MTNKNIMANAFNHHRRMATKYNETWHITRAQWLEVWQRSPDHGSKGYINRIEREGPWTADNIDFYPGTCPLNIHDRLPAPPVYPGTRFVSLPQAPSWTNRGTRTLSVKEWARELKRNEITTHNITEV